MAQPRYQVLERIDAGGMAEVFKANSTSLQGFQKLVAIKRILPHLTQNQRFVRMFLDEAKVSLHLNHTNTVQVFDLGIADGTYFIVMEFVDGTNLKNICEYMRRQNQTMPVEQAVFIAIEVCKGLTHAHDKHDQAGKPLSIVHRDISPPNVLISRAGEVKITDFGLAKAKSQAEHTDPGVVKGKFGYLSPEAAHGEDVDGRTDIFAVGILLWEMLAGRRLFLGDTDYDTLQQVRSAKIPPVSKLRSDVPTELDDVLARGLTRDIYGRYQSAGDFAKDLARFLFSYGQVVTNYDIADTVREMLDTAPKTRRTAKDNAVDQAVQRELNKIISLEQIDDLDRFLAQNYDSLPDEGEPSTAIDGDFEDPRMWAELGFGAEESGGDFVPIQKKNDDKDKSPWKAAGLDDLRRSAEMSQEIRTMAASTPAPPQAQAPARTRPQGRDTPAPAAFDQTMAVADDPTEETQFETGPVLAPKTPAQQMPAQQTPAQQMPTPGPAPIKKPSAFQDPQVRLILILAIVGIFFIIAIAGGYAIFAGS
ncbi:MAG: serine/threonine protein kinase [Bradymonadaceae bacterium]